MPAAVDWNSVIPRTPVNVKPMKLKPAARPRFSCRVPPIKNMGKNGKAKVPIRRPGSRRNLSRSRVAMTPIACISFIGQDPQVSILEGRRMRAHDSQRRRQRLHDLRRSPSVQLELKGSLAFVPQPLRLKLALERRAVRGVEDKALLQQLRLDFRGSAHGDNAAVVEDADAVGLLCLLEVVRGEEDRGLVTP